MYQTVKSHNYKNMYLQQQSSVTNRQSSRSPPIPKLKAQKLSGHISNLLSPFSYFLFLCRVLKWTGREGCVWRCLSLYKSLAAVHSSDTFERTNIVKQRLLRGESFKFWDERFPGLGLFQSPSKPRGCNSHFFLRFQPPKLHLWQQHRSQCQAPRTHF